ncbi:hypothetical protein CDG81_18690 [Actinopolyspora erythraea]|uniref:DUF4404 domain-containing protein n=1 Tax=Actinopolyspora erythraea TaxID=414996 RepID=A0A099D8G9_9ACTN|nr:hypothetical protein [Actinopolyspora erythraea]ASU79955.1 hypothetical protein CDG81_18690 [Actinopolyspora erythraea]KGI82324.1 hypothetical protein IL38_06225 [Actinopolyspora erythraea]
MLDEIRGQLQQITDTAPVSELQTIRTTLDELRALLHQMAGTSTNDDVHQASRLFGIAHDKTGEAVQALMYALEHVRSFSAVL